MKTCIHKATSAFEHLKATDTVTVFHGTDSLGMKEMLKFGLDATKIHHRSYNQGNERGLYITPSLKTAMRFGNWILEFELKAKYLYPTQRWGLGSQRKKDLGSLTEKYKDSFRPLVSFQMNETQEPQAMFLGYLPINKVKSIHTFSYSGTQEIKEVTLKEAGILLDTSPRNWDDSMSIDDMCDELGKKNDVSKQEILEAFTAYNDTDAIIRDFGLPRKLGLRLKQFLANQKSKIVAGRIVSAGQKASKAFKNVGTDFKAILNPEVRVIAKLLQNCLEKKAKTQVHVRKCWLSFGYKQGSIWIFGVNTEPEYRGKGYAKLALTQICSGADYLGIGLDLEAVPLDDETKITDLVGLYKQFGFVITHGAFMHRKPQVNTPAKKKPMGLQAISARLSRSNIKHVVVSADAGMPVNPDMKIKVSTRIDFPKGLDLMLCDWREGTQLRNRVSIDDPTRLKLTNWLTRQINKPDYWKHPLQEQRLTWTIRTEQFGARVGDPSRQAQIITVLLVDKHTRMPIYSQEDISTHRELELVEIKSAHNNVTASKQTGFKPNWTATEIKLWDLIKDVDSDGMPEEDVRKKLAGRAWDDLKKIPKPVDQAIENLCRAYYILKARRNKVVYLVPVLKDK